MAAFQCSSASRKFLNRPARSARRALRRDVSVLFSEPKIPQSDDARQREQRIEVSVLFSEPKIPQFERRSSRPRTRRQFQCSSASRKFLNVDPELEAPLRVSRCFSALQRAENSSIRTGLATHQVPACFSALQRAENSSIVGALAMRSARSRFQCSSASRKFLNFPRSNHAITVVPCFSALQRAENSSIRRRKASNHSSSEFQCSSASRKFLNPDPRTCVHPYSRLRRSRFVVPEPSWCVAMTPVY